MAQVERATSSGGKRYLTRVLSNLQFEGVNVAVNGYAGTSQIGFDFLGYTPDAGIEEVTAGHIELRIFIPDNFVIETATITFQHYPVYWDDGGGYETWGYCRNINAYKVTNKDDMYVLAAYEGEYTIGVTVTKTLIANCFGPSGYTPTDPNGGAYKLCEEESSNIKDYLTTGDNLIYINSSDTAPTWDTDFSTTAALTGSKTGYAKAIINIIGYREVK